LELDNEKLKEIKEAVKSGNIKLYQLEEYIFETLFNSDAEQFKQAVETAENLRAEIIEEELGTTLDKIKDSDKYKEKDFINTSKLKEGNIVKGTELKIGTAKIPLSIAGPVKIKTNNFENSFYVPIATNEAALIAGLNRGFKATNQSDGIKTSVTYNGMTRAPLLEANDIYNAQKFANSINDGKYNQLFERVVKENAEYSSFMDAKAFQIQNKIWLRLKFNTGEAMGMNSAVKYTTLIMKELLDQNKHPENKDIKLIALSGNLCCDKKSASINITEGRGYKAEATIIISKEKIKEIFNTTPEKIIKLNFWKNHFGSSLAGSVTGLNANAANTIAAIFAATGQDLAQVVESSTCYTFAAPVPEKQCENLGYEKGALKFSVTLPCLEIGTIGGGTQFGTAKEAINTIFALITKELANTNNANKDELLIEDLNKYINHEGTKNPKSIIFAQVIAAAVLSQELNLLAVLANEYALCNCHMALARGEVESERE
jgi:hydroxymethylglutaryl-CoA reductase (NADPH)